MAYPWNEPGWGGAGPALPMPEGGYTAAPVGPLASQAPPPVPVAPAPLPLQGGLSMGLGGVGPMGAPLAPAPNLGVQIGTPTPRFAPPTLSLGGAAMEGAKPGEPARPAVDPSKLALAPGAGAGGLASGAMPTPGTPGWGALNQFEQEQINLLNADMQARLRARGGGGPARTVKVQTGESLSGIANIDPATLADVRAQRKRGAALEKDAAAFERDQAYRSADFGLEQQERRMVALKQQEEIAAREQEALGKIRGQIDTLQQQVMAGEVDPDRLWRNASEGKRAGFLVAAALSGIGSAIAGKPGAPNAAIDGLMRSMDRDNAAQQIRSDDRRQKLNAAQQIYQFTKEAYGSEKAAAHAMNIARLEALKGQFDAEAEVLRTKAPIKATGLDGKPYETTPLDLALERNKNAIDQKIALEELGLQREINGQVSKAFAFKTVGGGGGGGLTLAQMAAIRGQQAKIMRDAAESQAKLGADARKGAPSVIMANGQAYAVPPGMNDEAVKEAQRRITMSEKGLGAVDALAARGQSTGGMVGAAAPVLRLIPGVGEKLADMVADPAQQFSASQLAAILAQASGAGVPSVRQEKLAAEATTPGPRREAALAEVKRELNQGIAVDLRSMGVK